MKNKCNKEKVDDREGSSDFLKLEKEIRLNRRISLCPFIMLPLNLFFCSYKKSIENIIGTYLRDRKSHIAFLSQSFQITLPVFKIKIDSNRFGIKKRLFA